MAAEGLSEGSSIGKTVTITMAGEFLYYLNGHVFIVETRLLRVVYVLADRASVFI